MKTGVLERPQIAVLLRGEAAGLRAEVQSWQTGRVLSHVAVICAGAALYGAAMGVWRAPTQALYTALKFPLIILLTVLGNALLNALLAPLLGLNLRFRQSLQAILASFTIAAAILGAFSSLAAFLAWNAPPLAERAAQNTLTFSAIQVTHVAVIAFAGVAANLKLLHLLRELGGSDRGARRVLFGWLAGNLFLGSQLSWMLRPFFGSPDLPVEFLRHNAFRGNFFEAVFRSLQVLLS